MPQYCIYVWTRGSGAVIEIRDRSWYSTKSSKTKGLIRDHLQGLSKINRHQQWMMMEHERTSNSKKWMGSGHAFPKHTTLVSGLFWSWSQLRICRCRKSSLPSPHPPKSRHTFPLWRYPPPSCTRKRKVTIITSDRISTKMNLHKHNLLK